LPTHIFAPKEASALQARHRRWQDEMAAALAK
jgi:hypothetical protein